MDSKNRFYEAASMLPPFESVLRTVPERTAADACEIRIRAGRPPAVETPSERHVCTGTAASCDDIMRCIKLFCDHSLYSAERELSEGWITLRGGHRAGFTGTAVIKGGRVTAIKDISKCSTERESRSASASSASLLPW